MMVFIKLLLAHLIGDFILQPTAWVKAKEEKKLKAYQLYLHGLVHGVLIVVFFWDLEIIPWALLLFGIHIVIDATKLLTQNEANKQRVFLFDQFAHVISIALITWVYLDSPNIDPSLFNEYHFIVLTALVFLTVPASTIITVLISRWSPHTEEDHQDSLKDAGKYIGILERIFVFLFVVSGNWEAIGFLLAAKSIFRFGDLKEPKERKLTEYILIGTLLSFGLAILTGMLTRYAGLGFF
jgi:hypothetical protein